MTGVARRSLVVWLLAMAAGALALASVPETRPISSRPVAEPVPSERQE